MAPPVQNILISSFANCFVKCWQRVALNPNSRNQYSSVKLKIKTTVRDIFKTILKLALPCPSFWFRTLFLSSFLFILTFVSDLFMPKKTCESRSFYEFVRSWYYRFVLTASFRLEVLTDDSYLISLALLLLIGGGLGWASTTLQKNQGISYAHWTKPAFLCLLIWERSKSIINAASTEQLQDTRYNHQKTYFSNKYIQWCLGLSCFRALLSNLPATEIVNHIIGWFHF